MESSAHPHTGRRCGSERRATRRSVRDADDTAGTGKAADPRCGRDIARFSLELFGAGRSIELSEGYGLDAARYAASVSARHLRAKGFGTSYDFLQACKTRVEMLDGKAKALHKSAVVGVRQQLARSSLR